MDNLTLAAANAFIQLYSSANCWSFLSSASPSPCVHQPGYFLLAAAFLSFSSSTRRQRKFLH